MDVLGTTSDLIRNSPTSYLMLAKSPRDRRRRALGERRSNNIVDLHDRNRQILRLKFMGMSNQQIAERLGITQAWVSSVCNSDISKEHLAAMHTAADEEAVLTHQRISETAAKAHKLLKEVIEGTVPAPIRDRISVASDYVNRAGFAPVAKSQIALGVGILNQEDIEELKRRAVKAANEAGVLSFQSTANGNGNGSD